MGVCGCIWVFVGVCECVWVGVRVCGCTSLIIKMLCFDGTASYKVISISLLIIQGLVRHLNAKVFEGLDG